MSHFLFSESFWTGYANITLSMSPEVLQASITWSISTNSDGIFQALQVIDIAGLDLMKNYYRVEKSDNLHFYCRVESSGGGIYTGSGFYNTKDLTWKCLSQDEIVTGHESYKRIDEDLYEFEACYGNEGYKTIIAGSFRRS